MSLARDLRNVPRYVLRYIVFCLALLGLAGLWEAHGDGKIPLLSPLHGHDPLRVSSNRCAAPGTSDQERWAGLAPALAIVDEISPPVAAWVRQEHAQGTLCFTDYYYSHTIHKGSVAGYDYLRGRLTIHRAVFYENDGIVATILCHEYRHSRQNAAKFLHYVLSFMFTADGDDSIVENDAELFEHNAIAAVFGR